MRLPDHIFHDASDRRSSIGNVRRAAGIGSSPIGYDRSLWLRARALRLQVEWTHSIAPFGMKRAYVRDSRIGMRKQRCGNIGLALVL
jgi:hypothetical protein